MVVWFIVPCLVIMLSINILLEYVNNKVPYLGQIKPHANILYSCMLSLISI